MDLDFAEKYAANQQDLMPSPEFARKYVYEPLKRIVDSLNNSDTHLVSVNVHKTITVGQETARVICALISPLSLTRLESVGGMQKTIQEHCPPHGSLIQIAYEPIKRFFEWRIEFVFDSATRSRLLEADRVATAKSVGSPAATDAEKLAMPLDGQNDKDDMLKQRRRIEEESRLNEAAIRSSRTDAEVLRLTSARAEEHQNVHATRSSGKAPASSSSLIRRTTTVAPATKVVVRAKKRPAPAISKDGKHTKAKLGAAEEELSTLVRPAKPPSILSFPVPFLNRLLCFIGGVEPEGANSTNTDYAKSHAFDTDLFVQTN